uniref:Uncharacterized protein n=1 Tax=Ralstonia solanacearum TaxID=305 RepID=A0A0S4WL57_RALSL|nr:protein of unknown function [Ralstonia solanacearum]
MPKRFEPLLTPLENADPRVITFSRNHRSRVPKYAFCLRIWYLRCSRAGFGRFFPFFLSLSLPLADVQSAESARRSP